VLAAVFGRLPCESVHAAGHKSGSGAFKPGAQSRPGARHSATGYDKPKSAANIADLRHGTIDGNFVSSLIDPLIAFVSANAWLGYLTLFLAALLEAVPVLGSVIPGSTIIIALSALVPGGDLQLVPVLASAAAGALLGDGSAFWIGHRTQRTILSSWPMSNYPRVIAQSEAFFHRWGALAVFFARFVPPIRAFVPITAGALGMPPSRFYPINIMAVLLWAPAHVLPGVLAVSALHEYGVGHHIPKRCWIPAVIVVAALAGLCTWWWKRRRKNIAAAEPVR
jgi:membrane protein DedA with SNARE-associated domain